jgi:hypothetical protein
MIFCSADDTSTCHRMLFLQTIYSTKTNYLEAVGGWVGVRVGVGGWASVGGWVWVGGWVGVGGGVGAPAHPPQPHPHTHTHTHTHPQDSFISIETSYLHHIFYSMFS